MSVLSILDVTSERSKGNWFAEIERSLSDGSERWVAAVREAKSLSDNRAWTLLSWAEMAATEVVRSGSPSLLESAAFALSLQVASSLDQRDVALVESLLRRGAQLAGVDFAGAVEAGCARAAEYGVEGRARLLKAAPSTPVTHTEEGEGATFAFRRQPANFDVEELERWLNKGGG